MSDGLKPIEAAAFRKLITRLSDVDDNDLEEMTTVEMVDEVVRQWEDMQTEIERLQSRVPQHSTKEGKVQSIVEYANNKRDTAPAVKVTPEEIAGVTGVSERYGYTLAHPESGLASEYEWILTPAEAQQYGSVEMDVGQQSRAIVIDFEGVHSTGVPLNKFINGREGGPAKTGQEVSET